jgi:hypothetical protein
LFFFLVNGEALVVPSFFEGAKNGEALITSSFSFPCRKENEAKEKT